MRVGERDWWGSCIGDVRNWIGGDRGAGSAVLGEMGPMVVKRMDLAGERDQGGDGGW